jgi:hypothetical protein
MAAISADDAPPNAKVFDPCSGSGRMLLAYAEQCRGGELIGQDIDLRCVRMTAINLALRNLYGFALWGNSLSSEVRLAYRTGFNMHGGVIRYAHPDELPTSGPRPLHSLLPRPQQASRLPAHNQMVPLRNCTCSDNATDFALVASHRPLRTGRSVRHAGPVLPSFGRAII